MQQLFRQSVFHLDAWRARSQALFAEPLRGPRQMIQCYAARVRPFLPSLPPLGPSRRGRWQRLGLGCTLAMMLGYVVLFYLYLFQLHKALGTHAEDLGIMDQVLWNTAHGHFWHQTICNSISDANCLGDTSRWAIHFEPLMLLLVPLYWVVPGPHTLQFVQVAGVALGAMPAYWLGSRRFGHPFAGVLAAAGYLLMPMLRVAVVDDFHMVTLAAPALMFALYYLYARQDQAFIIACVVALATKEQIPLDVFMLGLAVVATQQRWRLGLGVMALAVGWAIVALSVIHLMSPLGASPTADRYGSLTATLGRVPLLFTEPLRRHYLVTLVQNTGGLALFAPWMLVLALPSMLLNALSSEPNQYSGVFQYNADIAPFLLVAALEGALAAWRWLCKLSRWMQTAWQISRDRLPILRRGLGFALSGGVVLFLMSLPQFHQLNPNDLSQGATWPQQTAHVQKAAQFLQQIPKTAAVSAQANLVPHLSERRAIYQFPDGVPQAQYILLDAQSDFYPEPDESAYAEAVETVLASGSFALVDADDGYILLKSTQGTPTAPIVLPPQFCAVPLVVTILPQPTVALIEGCMMQGLP